MDDPCGQIDVLDYQTQKNPVQKHIWYQDQIHRKNNGKQNCCKVWRTDHKRIVCNEMVALPVDEEGVYDECAAWSHGAARRISYEERSSKRCNCSKDPIFVPRIQSK
jgi:hypothetical protein